MASRAPLRAAPLRAALRAPPRASRAALEVQVAGFVRRLHARIGPRCFTSGAFVLQVPTASARFLRFLNALTAGSSVRRGARTHDDFQRADKLARRRLCGRACGAPVDALRAGKQMEFVFRAAPLRGMCGHPDDEAKRVMLWYVFSLGPARFMYVKLESSPALSASHVVSAASRYLLKRKKKSRYAARRENAYKNGELVVRNALQLARDDAAALWPQAARQSAAYDASVRIGREMFVPAAVVAGVLG